MNRLYTPGQLARWEAARIERERLTAPAPIGHDKSMAETPMRKLFSVNHDDDLLGPEDSDLTGGQTDVAPHSVATQSIFANKPIQKPWIPHPSCAGNVLLTAPADEWGDWIEWAGGECPIPQAKAGEYMIRRADGCEVASAGPAPVWGNLWSMRSLPGTITAYRLKRTPTLLDQAIRPDLPPECLAAEVRPGDGPWYALADLAEGVVLVLKGQNWQGLHLRAGIVGSRRRLDVASADLQANILRRADFSHIRIVAPEGSA
jgi:hypothetical protein